MVVILFGNSMENNNEKQLEILKDDCNIYEKQGGGIEAEISAQIAETIPDYLLSPIIRIAAPNTPVSFSPVIEKFYIPQPERIKEEVKKRMEEY